MFCLLEMGVRKNQIDMVKTANSSQKNTFGFDGDVSYILPRAGISYYATI